MDYDTELSPRYKIVGIESTRIDDEYWHTIRCDNEIAEWIRTQKSSWYEHPKIMWYPFFDISEELYMMMMLKYGS
jgi:hypothetical protein